MLQSSKPIHIGLCMLMSLSIYLHGLHLDAKKFISFDMTSVDTITQWREDWLLCSTTLFLPTLLSDSQVSISLAIYGL